MNDVRLAYASMNMKITSRRACKKDRTSEMPIELSDTPNSASAFSF
jgi:hypothetical protein